MAFFQNKPQNIGIPIIHNDYYHAICDKAEVQKELEQQQQNLLLKQNELEILGNQFMHIGETQGKLSNISESICYYKAQLQLLKITKANVSDLFPLYEKLVRAYKEKKNYSQQLKFSMKLLKLSLQINGKQHKYSIKALYLVSNAYFNQESYLRSLQYSQKALKMIEEINEFDDKDTHCLLLYQMGLLQNLHKSEEQKELQYYLKALQTRKAHYGQIDLKVTDYYESVGQLHSRNLKTKYQGLKYYEQASKIRKQILGNENSYTISTYKKTIENFHNIIVDLLKQNNLKILNFKFSLTNEEFQFLENRLFNDAIQYQYDSEIVNGEKAEQIIQLLQKLELLIKKKEVTLDKNDIAYRKMRQK